MRTLIVLATTLLLAIPTHAQAQYVAPESFNAWMAHQEHENELDDEDDDFRQMEADDLKSQKETDAQLREMEESTTRGYDGLTEYGLDVFGRPVPMVFAEPGTGIR